jgi:hypothetical protein
MKTLENIKNKKREIVFIVSGLILLVITTGFVFYAMRFLIIKAGIVLEDSAAGENKIPKINFDGLKKIGVMR